MENSAGPHTATLSSEGTPLEALHEADHQHFVAVQSSKRRRRKWLVIGLVLLAISVLVIAIAVPVLLTRRVKENQDTSRPTSTQISPTSTSTTAPFITSEGPSVPSGSGWGQWSPCSVTCANGTQLRMRNCTDVDGGVCVVSVNETRDCVMAPCPVNASWTEWSQWSACSVTCANGTQLRTRNCSEVDITKCTGSTREARSCTMKTCPGSDCAMLYASGARRSGVYQVDPDGRGPFPVYCDMTSAGGGWTVFQRRQNGGVNFNRNWNQYKTGFGNLTAEFWLGNDYINRLTTTGPVLVVKLEDWRGTIGNATYREFAVSNELTNYTLTARDYSGDAGDSLAQHNGMKFTTTDRDNDEEQYSNCAQRFKGGWWFKGCVDGCNLNGQYAGNTVVAHGVIWRGFTGGRFQSLKYTEMKLRRAKF